MCISISAAKKSQIRLINMPSSKHTLQAMHYEQNLHDLPNGLPNFFSTVTPFGQTIGMRHPSIEATIKVNDWARVGTACMSSHQSMTLQGKRFRQKRRSTPATPRCRMTRSQASKDEIGTTVHSTLPQYAHKQTKCFQSDIPAHSRQPPASWRGTSRSKGPCELL